jgi:hypothetical protein
LRDAIAAALTALADVRAAARYRQISRAGDAVVRFDNATRDVSGFGWIVTCQVLIALPQDMASAEAWVDDHIDALVDALAAELVVGEVAPVQLQLDTGVVPVLQITGTRAA